MYCKNCGFLLNNGDKFCKICGTSVSVNSNIGNNIEKPDVVLDDKKIQQVNTSEILNNSVNRFDNVNEVDNVSNTQSTDNNQIESNSNVEITDNSNLNDDVSDNLIKEQSNTDFNRKIVKTSKNTNSKDNIKYIIFGVLLVIIAILVAVIVLFTTGDSKKVVVGNPTTSPDSNDSVSSKVFFRGFSFNASKNLDLEIDTDSLVVSDKSQTLVARISVFEGNYALLESRMDLLNESFKSEGYIVSKEVSIKTYDGVKYIVLIINANDSYFVVGYTQIDSTHMISIMLQTEDNNNDSSRLEVLSPLVKSISFESSDSDSLINGSMGQKLPKIDIENRIVSILQ